MEENKVKNMKKNFLIVLMIFLFACSHNKKDFIEDIMPLDETYETKMDSIDRINDDSKSIDNVIFRVENVTLYIENYGGGVIQCKDKFHNIKKVKLINPKNDIITDLSFMFYNLNYNYRIEEIDLSELNTSKVIDMSQMFDGGYGLKKIIFGKNFSTSNVKSMYKMFAYCQSLEELDLSGFDTKEVLNMRGMFYRCQSSKNLKVDNFVTKNVTDMSYMFYRLENIYSLDVSNFDTSNVTDFSNMFAKCKNLLELNLTSFNTEKAVDMSRMFFRNVKNKNIVLDSFDTKNVKNMCQMFSYLEDLEELNIAHFDYTNLLDVESCFEFSKNIKELDLHNLKNNANCNYKDMFKFCKSLVRLNMSNFDIQDSGILKGCNSLIEINCLNYDINKDVKALVDFNKSLEELNMIKKLLINDHEIELSNNSLYHLLKYGFVVDSDAYETEEYGAIYERNKYQQFPNFVTVDSVLHTFHFYFDNLLKDIEKNILYQKLFNMTKNMLETAKEYHTNLIGTEWEESSLNNICYLSVAMKLLDENYKITEIVKDRAENDLLKIENHEGILWLDSYGYIMEEDFSQYKPRGHYEGNKKLIKYFKAMMWYGRIQLEERDGLLMSIIMLKENTFKNYQTIDDLLTYFIGKTNAVSLKETKEIIQSIYGNIININEIVEGENGEKYNLFIERFNKLEGTKINSTPYILTSSGINKKTFSVIGQRKTEDAYIFNQLVSDYVEGRALPDVLDIPNVFNSVAASKILEENGVYAYKGYKNQIEKLKKQIPEKLKNEKNDNLYNGWLNVLITLIDKKDEELNYQYFMKNDEWDKKTLESFSGSFAELKHDTILYTAQSYGWEGDGDGVNYEFYDNEEFVIDDRGYLQPEIKTYEMLYKLIDSIYKLLEDTDSITDSYKSDADDLKEFINRLIEISYREVSDEQLTDEDYVFIRNFGADLEHFLYIKSDDPDDIDMYNDKGPAVIADVATYPPVCLEIATGNPLEMFVIVRVLDKLKISSGSVYDFYQFAWSANDRLTDMEWKTIMGFLEKDEYEAGGSSGQSIIKDFNNEEISEKYKNVEFDFQKWTNSYRGLVNTTFDDRDDLNMYVYSNENTEYFYE